MAINLPTPRAQPEEEVWFIAKSPRQTKPAEIISREIEDQLWSEKVMDTTTPTGLQNAAFFVVGRCFVFVEDKSIGDYSCYS